jgi:acylphosphatase
MTEMTDLAHLSAEVHGRVQGVFFRYFVQNIANRLGLKGYVRNLPNGALEVESEGTKSQLEKLVEQLKIGPPGARVKEVKVNWSDYSGQFKDFGIRY